MNKQQLKMNQLVDARMLDLHPEFRFHIIDRIRKEVGDAIMNRVASEKDIIVHATTKEEQINDLMSTNFTTTIDIDWLVRCKDCIWFQNNHVCRLVSMFGTIERDPEDYCSRGERRDD